MTIQVKCYTSSKINAYIFLPHCTTACFVSARKPYMWNEKLISNDIPWELMLCNDVNNF